MYLSIYFLHCAYLFIMATRGPPHCVPASSACRRGRLLSLQSKGSVAMLYRLSCPVARGIFQTLGSNPCPLCRQEDS